MEIEKKPCERCGTPFFVRRAGTRFCPGSSTCRTAAFRARQREQAAVISGRLDRLRAALSRVAPPRISLTREQTSS